MARRIVLCTLLFALLSHAVHAAKRHAVLPGAGRCLVGPLANEAYVAALALDATDVYFTDDFGSEISQVSRNGGFLTIIGGIADPVLVRDLVVDDTTIYVSTIPLTDGSGVLPPGAIYAIAKDGSEVRTVASSVNNALSIKVDATHVYWVSLGTFNGTTESLAADGKIERVRKDGAARETLASNLSGPYGLLLVGGTVLFSETGLADGPVRFGIRTVAKSGGTITHLEDTHAAADLIETGTDIVFYGQSGTSGVVGLFRMPKSGGSVTLLVDDEEVSGGPRIIDGQVYYAASEDRIKRVPLAGGSPVTVVVREMWQSLDFEVDECGLYFATLDGQLWKAPR